MCTLFPSLCHNHFGRHHHHYHHHRVQVLVVSLFCSNSQSAQKHVVVVLARAEEIATCCCLVTTTVTDCGCLLVILLLEARKPMSTRGTTPKGRALEAYSFSPFFVRRSVTFFLRSELCCLIGCCVSHNCQAFCCTQQILSSPRRLVSTSREDLVL